MSAVQHSMSMNYQERFRMLGCRPDGAASRFSEKIHALVSKSPILEDRTLDEIRKLANYMEVWTTPGIVNFINEGEPGNFMVLVISGSVEVVKKDRWGTTKRIAVVNPGETLGEMSMLDGEPRFASCHTLETTTFAVLHRDSFIRMIREEPVLGSRILLKLNQMLSTRLRQTGAKLVAYMETYRGA
ncbi:MAG TPA: cyclic nucleotide-binding domain-containing protein [Burkholderiaceae bacterium]|nr:cyclic nucleotide-binding domain-containing protein [Burkholderiaceae bacterium]